MNAYKPQWNEATRSRGVGKNSSTKMWEAEKAVLLKLLLVKVVRQLNKPDECKSFNLPADIWLVQLREQILIIIQG